MRAKILPAVVLACLALAACGSTTTIIEKIPGPTVTRMVVRPAVTITRTVIRTVTAPASSPSLETGNAAAYYPQWSQPGQMVPSSLQPYTPNVNGATVYTIVNCAVYQCTGYPGAGPDGSTCGPNDGNEQVCVR